MTNIEILQRQVYDLQAKLDEMTYERNEWRKLAQKTETAFVEISPEVACAVAQFGLSRTEGRVLQSLTMSPVRTFEQLGADIYGPADLADRSNSLKVWMVRLRQKLGDRDVISTIWGTGYRLTDEGRAVVRKAAARMAA